MRFLLTSALLFAGLNLATADGSDGYLIQIGNGASCPKKTKKGDTVGVNFNATYTNGHPIYTNYPSYGFGPPIPFVFKIGAGQVIKGWELGFLDMCVGNTRKITAPPALGYGVDALGPIPLNTPLLFYVELKTVTFAPAP
ncbi:related to FK506-binding protein 2 precursor [Rhynchosporium secalis]|uniref:peptidylprolyl isomerase n=1 Tax=Rhynchosporium secalis TaxID=38038 RepID=A0A1E1MSU0_RHYSE|nr:related to FK506-binding protein 2 precursor [Rhynchosporium secalis]